MYPCLQSIGAIPKAEKPILDPDAPVVLVAVLEGGFGVLLFRLHTHVLSDVACTRWDELKKVTAG